MNTSNTMTGERFENGWRVEAELWAVVSMPWGDEPVLPAPGPAAVPMFRTADGWTRDVAAALLWDYGMMQMLCPEFLDPASPDHMSPTVCRVDVAMRGAERVMVPRLPDGEEEVVV